MWKNSSPKLLKESYDCDLSYNDSSSTKILVSNVKHPEDVYTLTHALNRATIMDKWNIQFSGEDDFTLSEFLLKVELNARADNLCKDDVYITFFRLLKGIALQWYEACYETFANWTELIAGLKYRFQPIEYDFYLREEIKLRTQHIDESAHVYLSHMMRLFRKLDPPLSECDKVFIIQKNLLPRYSMQLVIRNVKSVDHIIKLCKMIDESGLGSTRGDEPLEPSCYPPKKSVPSQIITKRNLPKPLKIVAQANKEIAAAQNRLKEELNSGHNASVRNDTSVQGNSRDNSNTLIYRDSNVHDNAIRDSIKTEGQLTVSSSRRGF